MDSVIQLIDSEISNETIDWVFSRARKKTNWTRLAHNKYLFDFKAVPISICLEIILEVGCNVFRLEITNYDSSISPYNDKDTRDTLMDTDRVLFYFKKYLGF